MHRRALLRGGRGVAQRHDDTLDTRRVAAEHTAYGCRCRCRRHRRGAVLRREHRGRVPPTGEPRHPRNRRGTGHGLPRQAVRRDACAYGDRRICYESSCDMRALRQSGTPFAPPGEERQTGDARREGYLRTYLPPLLRRTKK